MVRIVKTDSAEVRGSFASILRPNAKSGSIAEVVSTVTQICNTMYKKGDAALVEYTNKFDGTNVSSVLELKVSNSEIKNAYKATSKEVVKSLEFAAKRIFDYHTKQMPADIDYTDAVGVRLGNIWKPMQRVGIYVPGGLASYPSSVLMNCIPARVAGVRDLAMVVPAPGGKLMPAVLVAAQIAGISEIYKIGGAQAVAALAQGTKTIPKVDKIVGPGNIYVAAAKRYLYGTVGIDMIAGPSEILVVADNKNNPDWIAADLLSQAEHDENAQSILITDDEDFANDVVKSVEKILKKLKREDLARKSWESNAVIIIPTYWQSDQNPWKGPWDEAVSLIDGIAPEHLELALDKKLADKLVKNVRNAGAIFIGRYTPEAIGDYTAGPSHVLPTDSTARFSSGLSVYDFLKRVSLIGCTKESFKALAKPTETLASEEGLGAHALSVSIRCSDG